MRDRRPKRVRGRTWPENPIDGDWRLYFWETGWLCLDGDGPYENNPIPFTLRQARALHRNLGAALAAWDGRELRIAARQPKEGGKP